VLKICQEYRKISNYIEEYQKAKELKNQLSTGSPLMFSAYPSFCAFYTR